MVIFPRRKVSKTVQIVKQCGIGMAKYYRFKRRSIFDTEGSFGQPLVPDIFRTGGDLPRERVGAKKFGLSLETQGSQTFGRDIPKLSGVIRANRFARFARIG